MKLHNSVKFHNTNSISIIMIVLFLPVSKGVLSIFNFWYPNSFSYAGDMEWQIFLHEINTFCLHISVKWY